MPPSHYFFNSYSYNYIALYNLGGITMHRTISDYKITKRKDGRYYVRIRDKGDVTHIYGKTKAEVKGKLEIKIEELNTLDRRRTEQSFPTRNITLANWARLCLDTFCASSISGNTYIGYERYIRLHFGKLADTPISKITNFMVQEHINNLSCMGGKEGMSEAYLTRVKVFLHMVFNYAVQNNLIVVNPTLGVKIPKTGLNENRSLTKEEELRLLQAARDFIKLFMFIVVVALYTGCRKGELFALKWRHIDFENRTIKIDSQLIREYTPFIEGETKTVYQPKNPKTKNSKRLIHMIEPLAIEFMAYKRKQLKWKEEHGFTHSEDDFVFASRVNTALCDATFYKNYHKLLKKAGIEDANFHTLRHTFATRCLESNINLLSISKTLGHSSIKVTGDIYIHMTASHQKECLDKLADSYYMTQQSGALPAIKA